MDANRMDRRRFAQTVGTALGATIALPELARAAMPGAGTPGVLPAARPHAAQPVATVRIDSNENPYGPSPAAIEAMTKSQSVAARYPDAFEDQLTRDLAKLHGVDADNVLLGCGSGEILRMADMAFLGADRKVVAAEPTFEAVLLYARVTRAGAVKVPLTADHRHDLEAMAKACDAGTGLVYVCNPNNPTGTIVGRDELARFIERVPASATILVDEAYAHYVDDPRWVSAFEWIGKAPNLVVVRTFSKIYGLAGMRLGYAVGAPAAIEAMGRHRIWSNANAAVLEAAIASLQDAGHVPRNRGAIADTRRWLCEEVTRDGRSFIPSQTNFVMIDTGRDVEEVIAAMRDAGVLVGRKFPSLPNWLRVSIGSPEDMRRFLSAFRVVVPPRNVRAA